MHLLYHVYLHDTTALAFYRANKNARPKNGTGCFGYTNTKGEDCAGSQLNSIPFFFSCSRSSCCPFGASRSSCAALITASLYHPSGDVSPACLYTRMQFESAGSTARIPFLMHASSSFMHWKYIRFFIFFPFCQQQIEHEL